MNYRTSLFNVDFPFMNHHMMSIKDGRRQLYFCLVLFSMLSLFRLSKQPSSFLFCSSPGAFFFFFFKVFSHNYSNLSQAVVTWENYVSVPVHLVQPPLSPSPPFCTFTLGEVLGLNRPGNKDLSGAHVKRRAMRYFPERLLNLSVVTKCKQCIFFLC